MAPAIYPQQVESPPAVALSDELEGVVTHYGASFNGRTLSCGTGYYTSENTRIAAVGPSRHSEWPCGTMIRICGPNDCLEAERHDACPGCGPNHIDLSEAGIAIVCGDQAGVCRVELQAFARQGPPPPPKGWTPNAQTHTGRTP
jgi:hypothetical protein